MTAIGWRRATAGSTGSPVSGAGTVTGVGIGVGVGIAVTAMARDSATGAAPEAAAVAVADVGGTLAWATGEAPGLPPPGCRGPWP